MRIAFSGNVGRVWTGLAVAAIFTGFAGSAALPAMAAEPQAPSITNPFDGVVIRDLPSVEGIGEPGSTATVTDGNGNVVCSALVSPMGDFSCSGTTRLPAGPQTLTVTGTGTDGAISVGNTVQVLAEYFPNLSYPSPGSLISNQAAFSGYALPRVEVQLATTDGVPICTTASDDWGGFQCTPTQLLPEGTLTLIPSMTTPEGAVVAGDPGTWTVIAAPAITSPANGAIVGDQPTFSGTALPGASIAIVHGRSGAEICSATVGVDGLFSCPMPKKLAVGNLDVFPQIVDNTVGAVAGSMITINVQVTPAILQPTDGGVVSEFLTVKGTAGAFSSVAVHDSNDQIVCTATADANGAFSCVAATALSPGNHSLTPVQTSFDGISVRGAAVTVSVPGTTPETSAPPVTNPTDTTSTVTTPAATSATTRAATAASGKLAATGADTTTTLAAVGGLMLLGGAVALVPGIRRRARKH